MGSSASPDANHFSTVLYWRQVGTVQTIPDGSRNEMGMRRMRERENDDG